MFQSLLSFLLASTLSIASISAEIPNAGFNDASLLSVASIPAQEETLIEPGYMSALGVIGFDVDSHTVLWEKNSQVQRPIASLTKLMTAYIIFVENDINTVVTVSENAAATTGSSMGLYSGETITVRNLLYGMLIDSGNDSAVALAEFNSGSESAFVVKMNAMAQQLSLSSTSYQDSTGLNSKNVSSPHDLAILSAYLIQDQNIRDIVKLSSTEVSSTDGYIHQLTNTNILLGILGVKGLKTGRTPAAGECLITLAESPDGHEVITVVLGSQNRFADTKLFIDRIYRAFNW